MLRALAISLTAAAGGLAVASVLIGAARPGYSAITNSLSVLGTRGSPGALWFDLLLVLVGLVLAVTGVALSTAHELRPVGLLLAACGALLVAAALIPGDAALSLTTAVHRSVTGAALLALLLSPAFAARRRVGSRRFARWSAAAAVLGLGGLAAGAGLLVQGFPGGLWERLLFGLGLLWVESLLLQLA